jgi:hypothetical protein
MKPQIIKMTTGFVLAVSTLFAQSLSSAYDDNRDKLQIGIKGGVNYSNLYNVQGQDFVATAIWGPAIGGYLSVPIGTYLGVQPEVLYSDKGYSAKAMSMDGPYSYIDRMSFLDIPIMLQFKPLPNVYLLGGLEYSYLLTKTYTQSLPTTTITQENFNNDNLRRNILGLIFELDFNF